VSFESDAGGSVELTACDDPAVAPCVEESSGELTAHVVGPGAFTLASGAGDVARFVASGGEASRALTVRFRR